MGERWADDHKINQRKLARKEEKNNAKMEKIRRKQENKMLSQLEEEKFEEVMKPKKRKNR